jgi:hypothetical protein
LIETSLSASGELQVRYTPPEGQRQLPLWSRSAGTRQVWIKMARPADDCARFDADGLLLREGCASAAFLVKPALLNLNATYEAAQDLSGTGVISHTSHYAATLPGQALRWRWLPPQDGYVLFEGRVWREPAELFVSASQVDAARAGRADGSNVSLMAHRMAYIGRAPLIEVPGGTLLRDPQLDEQRLARIQHVLAQSLGRLSQAYGTRPAGPVAVLTSTADLQGYHGDTDEFRMMRLRLDRDAARDQGSDLGQFVRHEAVHWWNSGVYRSDPNRPWLHEGHANWVALLLADEAGEMTPAAWLQEIEGALTRCLLRRGNQPAIKLPPGYSVNEDPYACGQTLMMAAQLQRAGRGDSPLQRLAGLHQGSKKMLEAGDLADWADAGPQGAMHRLLLDPGVGFADGLRAVFGAWLDETPLLPGQPLPASLRRSLGAPLMATISMGDCGGQDFWTLNDGFRLGTKLRCQGLSPGQEVVTLQRVSAEDPVGMWQAVRRACDAGQRLQVGYRAAPPTEVACPANLPEIPLAAIWRLKPSALGRLGLKAAAVQTAANH